MPENPSDELKSALEQFLKNFDISLDKDESQDEESSQTSYSEIISKTQSKLDDLNEKAEELYQKIGMTRDQVEDYVANPDHFTKEQWESLQKIKEEVDRFKKSSRDLVVKENVEKKISREHRKPVHRFGKRKNWMPL